MLQLDFRAAGIEDVVRQLQATPNQTKLAIYRAAQRTAVTLKTMAARGLKSELELRTISLLRKRLKKVKMKVDKRGAAIWFGLNDMPVSWFKGTPKKVSGGAVMKGHLFAGAFVAKSQFKGRQTIFRRTSKARLHIEEQLLPVSDKVMTYVEDKLFAQTEAIFWKNFERDLRARVTYSIGKK